MMHDIYRHVQPGEPIQLEVLHCTALELHCMTSTVLVSYGVALSQLNPYDVYTRFQPARVSCYFVNLS